MSPTDSHFIGVDVGASKVSFCLADGKGQVIKKDSSPTEGPRKLISEVKLFLNRAERDFPDARPSGIGIGAVGPLDSGKGIIVNPPNLPGWRNVPLVHLFEEEFSLPTFLENDATVGALAEREFGVQKDSLVYLTVSTGIGGGLIDSGHLIRGRGNAGEVGHMQITPYGPRCECGKRGCWEALASGTAIAKEGVRSLDLDEEKAEKVFSLAREGNEEAKKIIEKAACFLGVGISNLIELMDPQAVVLGGGLTNSWDLIKEKTLSTVKRNSRREVDVKVTSLGDEVVLLGASLLPRYRA